MNGVQYKEMQTTQSANIHIYKNQEQIKTTGLSYTRHCTSELLEQLLQGWGVAPEGCG
jgi:glutamyl/glutaminyl-tRNA synthetase